MKVENVERQIIRTITDVEKVITVELSEEEAIVLIATFGAIGGWRDEDNIRQVTDRLWNELKGVIGIRYNDERVNRYARHLSEQMRVNDSD